MHRQSPNWIIGNAKETSTPEDPCHSEIFKDEDDLYSLEGVINYSSSIAVAVENFVDTIDTIIIKHEAAAVTGPLPHGEMLVPLGAIKVIQDLVLRKVGVRGASFYPFVS